MFKKILITFIIILTAGCSTINMNIFSQANKETTAVLCIGMENSKFGNCPGAQVDATRMHNLLKKYKKNVSAERPETNCLSDDFCKQSLPPPRINLEQATV